MISAPTLEQLKSVDPDRCRASMFADKTTRERLLLLYAFHYELAKVPELVSEPLIGAIRYQWWRDALAEIYEARLSASMKSQRLLPILYLSVTCPGFGSISLLMDVNAI